MVVPSPVVSLVPVSRYSRSRASRLRACLARASGVHRLKQSASPSADVGRIRGRGAPCRPSRGQRPQFTRQDMAVCQIGRRAHQANRTQLRSSDASVLSLGQVLMPGRRRIVALQPDSALEGSPISGGQRVIIPNGCFHRSGGVCLGVLPTLGDHHIRQPENVDLRTRANVLAFGVGLGYGPIIPRRPAIGQPIQNQ